MSAIKPTPSATLHAGESYQERMVRKVRENPIVPIGALLTIGALVVAGVRLRQGNSRSLNNWLRMRVLLQGVTIGAIAWGTYSVGGQQTAAAQAQAAAEEAARREEKAGRERVAFEARLKAAEEVHDEEQRFLQGKGAEAPAAKTSPPAAVTPPAATTAPVTEALEKKKKVEGGGLWGWLKPPRSSTGDKGTEPKTDAGSDKKS